MPDLGELKPLLTALLLPPAAPLLLALLGVLLVARRRIAGGLVVTICALAALWLLSCNAVAVWLSLHLLPQVQPATPALLKSAQVQAIVVLGGGVQSVAPEYGLPQPSAQTAARLRYGLWLARQSGLPLAFSGGVGWANAGTAAPSEADVASRMAAQDGAPPLRWLEGQARDTADSARLLRPLLQADGVQRIALVSHAWHLPRAVKAFEDTGFLVTPAPMGYTLPVHRDLLEWLPSAVGLQASQQVLREWLAMQVARANPTR